MRSRFLLFSFFVLVLWPVAVFTETIRLVTGEVLIGEVKDAGFDGIKVATVFPSEKELTLTLSQVDPSSYYEILTARLDREPATRFRLAQLCLKEGLFAPAIVEARTASKLDPTLTRKAEELERQALENIAERLLDEAKTYTAVEQPSVARLYLQSILDRYPDTKSVIEAERLLKTLPKEPAEEKAEPVTDPRKKERIREELERGVGYLETADQRLGNLDRHFRSGRDEQLLRRVGAFYKKAFDTLKRAAARPTDDETLNREVRTHVTTARSRLVKLYLELGRLYLERGAIKIAEDACSQACLLEPENKSLHTLHQKIIDAKIATRFGGY